VLSAGRGFVGYWCMPTYDNGVNLCLTCLNHFFHLVLEKEGRLPPILFLQMDNAAKENKNVVGKRVVPCCLAHMRLDINA
jgi:hypothetical protein